jgi:hypothetical protein
MPSLPRLLTTTLGLVALSFSLQAHAAAALASYHFNGSLAADQASAPDLVAIDPLGLNSFETALVYGVSQQVYRWSGNGAIATQQAGLSLNTTGLLADYSSYSVAMTFEFASTAPFGGGWRRLIDTQGRQSDNGFYLSPSHNLEAVQVNPIADGSTVFTTPGFHDVVLNVSREAGRQRVTAYLDGKLEFSTLSDVFTLANADNPGHLLQFFADNTAAGAQQEFANGRIAALVLSAGPVSAVPEPATGVMTLGGLALLAAWRRRSARVRALSGRPGLNRPLPIS